MNASFWLGLALSIPIGIIVNLFTPRFSAWIANRNQRYAKKRENRRLERLAFAKELYENPFAYSAFLQTSNTRLFAYLMLITVIFNVPFYVQYLLGGFGGVIAAAFFGAAIVFATYLAVLFLNTRRRSDDVAKIASMIWVENKK